MNLQKKESWKAISKSIQQRNDVEDLFSLLPLPKSRVHRYLRFISEYLEQMNDVSFFFSNQLIFFLYSKIHVSKNRRGLILWQQQIVFFSWNHFKILLKSLCQWQKLNGVKLLLQFLVITLENLVMVPFSFLFSFLSSLF